MELTVNYLGGAQFEAQTRGHTIICDQPESNGGADEGMTPPEFLLASLATCAGYYAVQYLKARSLPMEGVSVRISAEKVLNPARLDNFRITIETPGVMDQRHLEGVQRSAGKCLVKNTLLLPPSVSVEVFESVSAAP